MFHAESLLSLGVFINIHEKDWRQKHGSGKYEGYPGQSGPEGRGAPGFPEWEGGQDLCSRDPEQWASAGGRGQGGKGQGQHYIYFWHFSGGCIFHFYCDHFNITKNKNIYFTFTCMLTLILQLKLRITEFFVTEGF